MQNVKVEPAKEIDEYSQSSANSDKGLSNDTNHKTRKRPILLSILTVVAVLLLISDFGYINSSLKNMDENPAVLFLFLLNVSAIGVLIGLYYGRYWAWVGIQVLWSVNLGINISETISSNLSPTVFLTRSMVISLLWLYIYSKRVRVFCSL